MVTKTKDERIEQILSSLDIALAKIAELEARVGVVGAPEPVTEQMQLTGTLTGSIAHVAVNDPSIVAGNVVKFYLNGDKRGESVTYDGVTPIEIYVNTFPVDGSTLDIEVIIENNGQPVKRLVGATDAATSDGPASTITVGNVIDETPIWSDKPSVLPGASAQVTLTAPNATDQQYNFDFHVFNPDLGDYEDLTTRTSNDASGVVNFGVVDGFPVNAGSIRYRIRRWGRAEDGSNVPDTVYDFDDLNTSVNQTVQTATVEVVTGGSVTFDTITRKMGPDTMPASFVDRFFGPPSISGETTELPKADGTTENYSVVTASNQVESASSEAQLVSRLRSIPDGATVNITGGVSGYTIPADAGGSPGNPKYITGNLGGGRSYIKASNLVFKDGPLTGALRFEGDNLTAFNVIATSAGSFELYAPDSQPRPQDHRIIKCSFTNPDQPGRGAIKTSDGSSSTSNVPQRFYVDSCYFNGYEVNAIVGVGLRENYPAKKNPTYGYITRNRFEQCQEEVLTIKDVAMFIGYNFFDGRGNQNYGLPSLRNTHDCVFVNNIYAGSAVEWLQVFGYNHVIQNNIVLMDRSYRPLQIETPAAGVRSPVWGMEHYRITPAYMKFKQNMFFAPNGFVSDAGVHIREAYGNTGYQNWQNLNPTSGFDLEGVEMEDNIYVHDGTLPGYQDDTGRMPESKWNADNTARIANQVAFNESGLASTGASTTWNTNETYAGIWEGGSDVVVPLPPWIDDGSLAEVS